MGTAMEKKRENDVSGYVLKPKHSGLKIEMNIKSED